MVLSLLLPQHSAIVVVERPLGVRVIEHRMVVTMGSPRQTAIQALTALARDPEPPHTPVPMAAVHLPGERHLNHMTHQPQHQLMQITQLPTPQHQRQVHLHLPLDSQQMRQLLVVTTAMHRPRQLPDRIQHH